MTGDEPSTSAGPEVPVALPPPSETTEADQPLEVGGTVYRFDALGPMVVNSDGTLSRIANWGEMTQHERERTVRVLGKRNQLRLSNEDRKVQEAGGGEDEEKLTLAQQTS